MSIDSARGRPDAHHPQTFRVRLPGFLTEQDVGLGDVIKHVTSAVGVRPCGDCARRAAALNRRVAFSGRRRA